MTLTSTEGKVNQLKISESKVVRVFTVISKEVERGGGGSTKFITRDLAFIFSIKCYINFKVTQLRITLR